MRKLLIKFLIYLIPLPVYLACILLIDPFNFYGLSQVISGDTKKSVSLKNHPQLWKMLEYKHKKTDCIILGDSRAAQIDTDHVSELSGKYVYNFAFAGGTLLDMFETFWYADDLIKLKEVYIGINFNLYNDYEKNNRVIQAQSISHNFFTYSFSKVVFTTTIQLIKKQFFNRNQEYSKTRMNFDDFWKFHLDINGRRFYQKYQYPEQLYQRLQEIAKYCRDNNIELIFFIPPNHADWQKRKFEFDLSMAHDVFLQDIKSLGNVYNFDVVNDYTSNKKNFRDPVHPVNDSLIVHSIWDKP